MMTQLTNIVDSLVAQVERLTKVDMEPVHHIMVDGRRIGYHSAEQLAALCAEIERLRGALREIDEWAEAYPLSVFPEPDFAMANSALQSVGMTMDAISASNMRHVLVGVKKIVSAVLDNKHV
jgi:hypothetical protein